MSKIFTRLNLGDVAYSSGGKCFKRLSTVAKLSAPTISLNGDIITITDASGLATEFGFYHNGVPLFTTSDTVVDLSEKLLDTFGAGTYNITVTAFADGYEESEPSNAVEYVVEEESVPTDLTGYTVIVPKGWSATAGYGAFGILGTCNGNNVNGSFRVGYYKSRYASLPESTANNVTTRNSSGAYTNYSNAVSLTISIEGGSDVSNSSLIQWFVDNNATFEKTA